MQLDWRAISGPALTVATAVIALAVDHLLIAVPNPAPLFVCIVALAGSLSGLRSSLISAALAFAFPVLIFLIRDTPVYATASDLASFAMLAVAVVGTAVLAIRSYLAPLALAVAQQLASPWTALDSGNRRWTS